MAETTVICAAQTFGEDSIVAFFDIWFIFCFKRSISPAVIKHVAIDIWLLDVAQRRTK